MTCVDPQAAALKPTPELNQADNFSLLHWISRASGELLGLLFRLCSNLIPVILLLPMTPFCTSVNRQTFFCPSFLHTKGPLWMLYPSSHILDYFCCGWCKFIGFHDDHKKIVSRAVFMQTSPQMELAMFTRASVFILSSVNAAVMAGGRVSCSLTLLSMRADSPCPWCSVALAFCDRIWIHTDVLDWAFYINLNKIVLTWILTKTYLYNVFLIAPISTSLF